jgi:PRMT5 arginine-N-methyltransferase/ribosomal protein L11 methyltransferase PrmA
MLAAVLTSFLAATKLVAYHRSMIQDRERTGAYHRAIHEVVRPGDVVLDIGAGSGVLSLFACQAGARRVYAVEAGHAVEIARELTRQNDVEDRVVLINESSYLARIEEPVDVLVTETLWNFGFGEGMLGSVRDARERLLKRGGRIVPAAIGAWLAPVEMPDLYGSLDRWPEEYEVDMSIMRSLAMNNVHQINLDRGALLAEPELFSRVDMHNFQEDDVEGKLGFTASRAGTVHGLAGWFEATLSPNVRIANAPPNPAPNWGHAFFPLGEPVDVRPGDRLAASMRSTNNGDMWSWGLAADGTGGAEDRPGYTQSTLWGFPLSLEEIHKRSPQFSPILSRRGEVERFVLDLLDGCHAISAIEDAALERFPDTLHSRPLAAAYVRSVVARCGADSTR